MQTSDAKINKRNRYQLKLQRLQRRNALIVILFAHVGTLLGVIYSYYAGISRMDWLLLISMFVFTELGITVGYHRLFTHKSFEASRWVRYSLAIAGSMAAQGPVSFWAASHRQHHGFVDQANDPHSPHQAQLSRWRSFWYAHVNWLFSFQFNNRNQYIRDIRRDQLLTFISRHYYYWVALGLAIPAVIGGLVTLSWQGLLSGFIWGGVIRLFLVYHATWSVNSFCHLFGSKAYQTKDHSRNNWWVALITLGEGWHNNHHAFPRSARHGLKNWQFDPSYYFIKLLEKCRAVWNVELPKATEITNKTFK